MSEDSRVGFGVIRTIRRVSKVGKSFAATGGGGGGGGENMLSFGLIRALMTGNPYMLAILGGITAFTIAEPYLMFLAGAGPNPADASITMADKQHRFILQRAYGSAEGDRLYNLNWSNRQIEQDLRTKLP
jgi:hypothetical protein